MTTPKAIADELAKLEEIKAEVLTLEPVATIAHEVAEALPALKIDVAIIRWTLEPVFVALKLHDLKDFRQALPVLTKLAALGFHTDKKTPYSDYHEIKRRSFNLVTDEEAEKNKVKGHYDALNCRLRLFAFLIDEGANCKRVQTGTKLEPIYEFVCEDGLTPTAESGISVS